MIDLLDRADPARDLHIDPVRLRAGIDERIGVSAPLRPASPPSRRPWLIAAAAFAAVLLTALPVLLRQEPPSVYEPRLEGIADLPGVTEVVPLATGGLQAMGVDGDTIWVMSTLANTLQRVAAQTGEMEDTLTIGARIEGVVVGAGYVWLLSPDDGGQVLRFDPETGSTDLTIPIGGSPGWAHWLGDSLWVSNDQSELIRISADGEIVSTGTGELKGGEGLGYLWVNDPETDLISSLDENGALGAMVVPTEDGLDTMTGAGIRQVAEADGRLFLLDGDFPWGTNLNVYDPNTGEFRAFTGLTFGLLDLIEFDGFLWVTTYTDHVLIRIDPATAEQRRYPLPGRVAGLEVADGSLWVSQYHPGSLIRLDTSADLIETGPIVADDWNRFPHRLLCTGIGETNGPTVLLQPSDWIDYGSWSVIQARLTDAGYLVCASGYVQGETTPDRQAADLSQGLAEAGIAGPYVLAASVDGVHAARLFAAGRDDIAGMVLVDPMPVGYQDFYDDLLPDFGHPPWLDLAEDVSASLDSFGEVPLVVVEQDPKAVFLSPRFVDSLGEETGDALNQYWQDGLAFYAGLSTDSRSVLAEGTGFDSILWDRPDLVVDEIIAVLEQSPGP